MDGHGHCLMPAMPIFQKYFFFKKGPKNQQILKHSIFFACLPPQVFKGGSNIFFAEVNIRSKDKILSLYQHLHD